MSLFEAIDNYCERTGPEIFDEPLNALTNLSFFIAAAIIYTEWRKPGRIEFRDQPLGILLLLLLLVGIGSTLFHIFGNRLTMMLDVLPITAFTFYYLWMAMRRLLLFTPMQASGGIAAFVIFSLLFFETPSRDSFNGSLAYVPCLIAILLIGARLRSVRHPRTQLLQMAGLCFLISLVFRTYDFAWCEMWPRGTHFLWHAMNGFVLYLLTKAVMLSKRGRIP